MRTPSELIAGLEDYVEFLKGLRRVDRRVWTSPMGTGKWSIHDTLAHIMGWDRNLVERILPCLAAASPPPPDVGDGDAFNKQSVQYGRSLDKEGMLEESIRYRSELIAGLKALPLEAYHARISPGRSETLSALLDQEFIGHDRHHEAQIRAVLSRVNVGD